MAARKASSPSFGGVKWPSLYKPAPKKKKKERKATAAAAPKEKKKEPSEIAISAGESLAKTIEDFIKKKTAGKKEK
jgi:hypothetical protein